MGGNPYEFPWQRQVEAFKAQGRYQEALSLVEARLTTRQAERAPTDRGEAYNASLDGQPRFNLLPHPTDTSREAIYLWFEQTLVLQRLARYEAALGACEHVIQLAPEMDSAWRLLGDICRDMQQYEEALVAYQHAITLDGNNAATWSQLGVTYYDIGNYAAAEDAYDQALVIDPQNAVAWNNKGRELNRQGQHHRALQALGKATRLNPESWNAWNNLGNALLGLGRPHDAIEAYRNAVAVRPTFAMAWGNLADVFVQLGRLDEALAAVEHGVQYDKQNTNALLLQGRILLDQKRFGEAEQVYWRAISTKRDQPDAWINLGVALGGQRKFVQAVEALNTALQLPSVAVDAHLSHIALWEKGQALFELKRFREAQAVFRSLTERWPDAPRGWANLATSELCLHHFQRALDAFTEALTRGEVEFAAQVWTGKGDAHRGLRQYAAAHEAYARALDLDPTLDDTWVSLFYLYRAQWRFSAAAHALAQVVKLRVEAQNRQPAPSESPSASGNHDPR